MRPWVILEVYTAITHDVPIVALNVNNANPYDYGSAMDIAKKQVEDGAHVIDINVDDGMIDGVKAM